MRLIIDEYVQLIVEMSEFGPDLLPEVIGLLNKDKAFQTS
jgi:hypothetical protein